jgi:thiosulfate/3-mercaptopyruvate sulfurtransferase
MVVYVLEKFGIQNIKIVDGGIAEWKKQGFEPARDYFGNPAGSLPAEGNPGIAANVDDVQAFAGKPGNVLVDARPLNEFQGDDDVWLRKGHIPGAISFHWARLVEKDNTHKFKPFSETKAELEKAGITKDKNIIAYCGTSREGSLLLFYLKHVAGYPNVRLYEGAWKEYVWLKGKSLPAETGGVAAGK